MPFREREDRVGAPVHGIGGAAARLPAAAPFVGEQHFGAGVVEVGRMPEGVVRIAHRGDAHRVHRVRDVEQDAVAGARARGQAERGVDRDVVALVGDGGGLRAVAVVAALPETVNGAGLRVGKDARAGDDLRLLRMRQRNLDDVDAEQSGVGILVADRRLSSRPVLLPGEPLPVPEM